MSEKLIPWSEFVALPPGWYYNLAFVRLDLHWRFCHITEQNMYVWTDAMIEPDYRRYSTRRASDEIVSYPLVRVTALMELLYGFKQLNLR